MKSPTKALQNLPYFWNTSIVIFILENFEAIHSFLKSNVK